MLTGSPKSASVVPAPRLQFHINLSRSLDVLLITDSLDSPGVRQPDIGVAAQVTRGIGMFVGVCVCVTDGGLAGGIVFVGDGVFVSVGVAVLVGAMVAAGDGDGVGVLSSHASPIPSPSVSS